MSDLVSFLLERLEETRRDACYLHNVTDGGAQYGSVNEVRGRLTHQIVADIDAKRRLIEAVVDKDPFDAMGAESAYERLILVYLALPYADHPGYDERWRPE